MRNEVLLSVKNLKVSYLTRSGLIKALHGVSFEVKRGETLGLTGESGCGKTTTALAILRLLSNAIIEGQVLFKGEDLLKKTEGELRLIRGRGIAMIFQELTGLNPVLKIGDQIREVIKIHRSSLDPEMLLHLLRLPEPRFLLNCYPHQLSSGMRQRVMIALAIASKPELVIADEPTSMLDATVQLQILNLLKQLKKELELSMLLISHDLNMLMQICDKIAFMHVGKLIELCYIDEEKLHPYVRFLLNISSSNLEEISSSDLIGDINNKLQGTSKGCFYQKLCKYAKPICYVYEPEFREVKPGHFLSCHAKGY
ncbi:MAG: ABC transporter ATP-binding protein [Methanocellales archaeon]